MERQRTLPASWAPLARAVLGPARAATPRMVTGPLARAVLRSTGVPAATVGTTIYLASAPELSNRAHRDVVAHELAHVAAGSTQPRFHGGPANAEERRARQVGEAAAEIKAQGLTALGLDRLPVGGAFPAVAPNVGGGTREGGTTAGEMLAALSGGGPPAAAGSPSSQSGRRISPTAGHPNAAARVTRAVTSAAPLSTPVPAPTFPLQRATTPIPATAAPGTATTTPAATTPIQRFTTTPSASSTLSAPAATAPTQTQEPTNPTATRDQFEAILEALEERVLADLERRGGRFAGEF